MKILFLGYAVSEGEMNELNGISVAGNKMQLNILLNLEKYSDLELKVITVYPLPSFPNNPKIYINKKKINIFSKIYATRISFINLPYLKQLWQTLSVYKAAKKIVKKDKDTIIFTFNLFPQVGLPLIWLKKKYHSKTVVLLADLPIDDNNERKGISVLFRKYFDMLTKKAMHYCDKYIVLNRYAMRYVPEKKFIVVEGGVNTNEISSWTSRNNNLKKIYKKKIIVYSGALSSYSGVIELTEAMKKINDETVELHIYGSGQLETKIKEISISQKNIEFFGRVNNAEILEIQQEAWLLVNPRPVDDPIAQVTFPSKIFEYMLSGTPVLTTKLNGFEEEYLDKMYFCENNNPQIMADKINQIISVPNEDMIKMALKAKNFVRVEKSWENQVQKIYEFVKS